MKQYSLLVLALLSALFSWGQSAGAPGFFTYQGIARSADGSPISNNTIGLKISILNDGLIQFAEEFTAVQTSNIGNFVIRVGTGLHLTESGLFDEINWEDGPFQMQVEMKPPSSTNYILIGTTDLRSVPYALFAAKAGNAGGVVTAIFIDGNILTIEQENGSQSIDLSSIFESLTIDLNNDELQLKQNGIELGEGVDLSVYSESLGINTDGILTVNGEESAVNLYEIIETQTEMAYNDGNATLSLNNGNSVQLSALQQKLKLTPENELIIVPFDDPQGSESVNLNVLGGGESPWITSGPNIYFLEKVGIGTENFDTQGPEKLIVQGVQAVLNEEGVAVIEQHPNYDFTVQGSTVNVGASTLVRADNGNPRILMSAKTPSENLATSRESGSVILFGENGNANVLISSNSQAENHGRIVLCNDQGLGRLTLIVDTLGSGRFVLFGPNGSRNAEISSLFGSELPNHGSLVLFGENGSPGAQRLELYVDANGVGNIKTYGSNGTLNFSVGSSSDNPNHGELKIYDETGEERAGIRHGAEGFELFADQKCFRMNYPGQPDKEIWYSALEGPEAGAYLRGTETLAHGEAVVTFPDHFEKTINHETMTVYLSPLSVESLGLAVIQKLPNGFVVKELNQGTGDYSFDWEVKAVRKGFENFEVVRSK